MAVTARQQLQHSGCCRAGVAAWQSLQGGNCGIVVALQRGLLHGGRCRTGAAARQSLQGNIQCMAVAAEWELLHGNHCRAAPYSPWIGIGAGMRCSELQHVCRSRDITTAVAATAAMLLPDSCRMPQESCRSPCSMTTAAVAAAGVKLVQHPLGP